MSRQKSVWSFKFTIQTVWLTTIGLSLIYWVWPSLLLCYICPTIWLNSGMLGSELRYLFEVIVSLTDGLVARAHLGSSRH